LCIQAARPDIIYKQYNHRNMGTTGRLFDFLKSKEASSGEILLANRSENRWKEYRRYEILYIVDNTSKVLISLGLAKGDRVAIMSVNRPEWTYDDFACNQLSISTVPLYPTLSEQDLTYLLNDDNIRLAFVNNQELTEKLEKATREKELH